MNPVSGAPIGLREAVLAEAQLMAKEHPSKDARFFAASVFEAFAAQSTPLAEVPVAWRVRFHTDDSLAGKPNVRPWMLTDKPAKPSPEWEVEPLYLATQPPATEPAKLSGGQEPPAGLSPKQRESLEAGYTARGYDPIGADALLAEDDRRKKA